MLKIIIIITVALQGSISLYSQGFINFNFESARVVSANPPDLTFIDASRAFPGWTVYGGTPDSPTSVVFSSVFYNNLSLGGAMVSLQDTNAVNGIPLPLQGNYSVLLEGSIPQAQSTASIGQVGTIPVMAQTLTFWGDVYGSLQISFGGQLLNYLLVGSTPNYNIYSADISAFSGQTGQLLFTAQTQTYALLDNIQFSNIPVPEPGTWSLLALGVTLIGFSRLTRRKL